jgi:transketolase
MSQVSMRDAFFDRLYELAAQDRNIILVSADMGAPSLDKFRTDLAGQYVNVGIAEQNMITVAAGLALSGKKVFTYAIMPFVTLRCYEITRVDLSLMNLPVTIIGVGAGFSYDDSGPTHHSTEDISVMRALPNMTILNASDSVMATYIAENSCRISGPSYARLDREVLPALYQPGARFDDGVIRHREGKDLAIIATGNMTHKALEIAGRLAGHSVETAVIDLFRLKPVNEALLLKYISQSKKTVTLEEHFLNGGIGSVVAEVLADNDFAVPLKRFGIRDKYYYVYGGRDNILQRCGLDAETVSTEILKWLKK